MTDWVQDMAAEIAESYKSRSTVPDVACIAKIIRAFLKVKPDFDVSVIVDGIDNRDLLRVRVATVLFSFSRGQQSGYASKPSSARVRNDLTKVQKALKRLIGSIDAVHPASRRVLEQSGYGLQASWSREDPEVENLRLPLARFLEPLDYLQFMIVDAFQSVDETGVDGEIDCRWSLSSQLADNFYQFADKKPTLRRDIIAGEPYGPFFDFLKEVFSALELKGYEHYAREATKPSLWQSPAAMKD